MNDAPLHILMTDPHLKGGGQVRYVTNLARELTRLGHRVTIGCKPDSVLVGSARDAGCELHNAFAYRGGLRPRVWARRLGVVLAPTPTSLHAASSTQCSATTPTS